MSVQSALVCEFKAQSRAHTAAPTARPRATASEATVALSRARWRWLVGLVGLQLLLYYSIYYYTTTTTKQGGANGRLESIVESLLRRPPSSFSPSPRCLEGRMPLPAACTTPCRRRAVQLRLFLLYGLSRRPSLVKKSCRSGKEFFLYCSASF